MPTHVRRMTRDDITDVVRVWHAAIDPLRATTSIPQPPPTPADIASERERFFHLMTSDPNGCFVAEDEGAIVGLSQSMRRGHLFVLSRLGVAPDHQDQGTGRMLLSRALEYGESASERYIWSSRDPRAMHSYVRAGFTLRPCVHITGCARTVQDVSTIHVAASTDIDALDAIDLSVRGVTRRQDLEHWFGLGATALIDDDGGYLLFDGTRLLTLCASAIPTASRLLERALCGFNGYPPLEVSWVCAEQQWAIETATACGASLGIQGAMMTKGVQRLPVPYLPNALLG